MLLVERFFKYVSFDTQSDESTKLTPSTPGQMIFANYLAEELSKVGLSDIHLDDNGYLTATLPPNCEKEVPVIGFIAHMDTSPELTGRKVSPQIVNNYDGNDIVLNKEENIILHTTDFPEIKNYIGQDLILTNGKTLLGSDDKAGIAEIMSAMEHLIAHPEIKHGAIRIAFTPDEEIGQGAENFDVERFHADWAYTIDGGQIGELQYENFNAASAKLTFNGVNVHPGYAKGKMVNSIRIANQFISMLPRYDTPEHTEGYEGFFHLIKFDGTVERSTLTYIIRDFDKDRFERRKKEFEHLGRKINAEFGPDTCTIELHDQYYNMYEKIVPNMNIVRLAHRAMEKVGVKPLELPIRGGTDGCQLSFKGLVCPNIFSGGHNFHGRYEYIPVQSMEKAVDVIVKICELAAEEA